MDTETPMEEVKGDIDLKGLDLVSLEEACKNNAMHAITPKQIQLLTDILQSPSTRSKLGVAISHLKDSKKSIKEAKKKVENLTFKDLQHWVPTLLIQGNTPSLRNSSPPTLQLPNESHFLEYKRHQQP